MGSSFISTSAVDEEDVEEEVQELGHAETYANYMPKKGKILYHIDSLYLCKNSFFRLAILTEYLLIHY